MPLSSVKGRERTSQEKDGTENRWIEPEEEEAVSTALIPDDLMSSKNINKAELRIREEE